MSIADNYEERYQTPPAEGQDDAKTQLEFRTTVTMKAGRVFTTSVTLNKNNLSENEVKKIRMSLNESEWIQKNRGRRQ